MSAAVWGFRAHEEQPALPFLKWAGGKQWLAPVLARIVNTGSGRYFEPFVGGGAVYFHARPPAATLSDSNAALIEAFTAVQSSPNILISHLRRLSYSRACYYKVRGHVPIGRIQRAARFIYLNRTCWQGLYRVNLAGDFNVPIGSFSYPPDFSEATRIRRAHVALQGVDIQCCDFDEVLKHALGGDTVFIDPPYTTAHDNNGFIRYNEHIFSWDDQKRLAGTCRRLAAMNVRDIVTNAAHNSVAALYRSFYSTSLTRSSLIAASASNRGTVGETLYTSFPIWPENIP